MFSLVLVISSIFFICRTNNSTNPVGRVCDDTSSVLPEFCEKKTVDCNVLQKFRSYNGTCNNLKHSEFYGVSYRPFRRSLPPDYADGK